MTTQSNLLSVLLSSSKQSGREGKITCAPALPGYSSWGWKEQEQFPRRGTDSAPKETFLNCLACFPSSIINPLYLPIVALSTVFHTSNVNTNTGKQQVCRREAKRSGAVLFQLWWCWGRLVGEGLGDETKANRRSQCRWQQHQQPHALLRGLKVSQLPWPTGKQLGCGTHLSEKMSCSVSNEWSFSPQQYPPLYKQLANRSALFVDLH